MPHFPPEVIATFLQTYKLMYKCYLFSHPHQQFRSKTSFFFFLQFNGCKIAFYYSLAFSWLLIMLTIIFTIVFPLLWKASISFAHFFLRLVSVFIHGCSDQGCNHLKALTQTGLESPLPRSFTSSLPCGPLHRDVHHYVWHLAFFSEWSKGEKFKIE